MNKSFYSHLPPNLLPFLPLEFLPGLKAKLVCPSPTRPPACHIQPPVQACAVHQAAALGVNNATSKKPSRIFLTHGLVCSLSMPDAVFPIAGQGSSAPTTSVLHHRISGSQNLGSLRITEEHTGNADSTGFVLQQRPQQRPGNLNSLWCFIFMQTVQGLALKNSIASI